MEIITMLSPVERENKRCHFCNETRSVKYIVEVFDPVIDANNPSQVYACNKCVGTHILNEIKERKGNETPRSKLQ